MGIVCPICGGNESAKVMDNWRLCKCGAGFQSPAKTMDEMAEYYKSDYRPEGYPREHDRRVWANRITRQAEIIELAGIESADSILDVGCASGALVLGLQKILGARYVAGTELNLEDMERCHESGVDCRLGIDQFDTKFDLVTMSHSLEHFDDPMAVLRDLHDRLSNSHIMVELPHPTSQSAWQDFHYVVISETVLERMFRETGWHSVTARTLPGIHQAVAER